MGRPKGTKTRFIDPIWENKIVKHGYKRGQIIGYLTRFRKFIVKNDICKGTKLMLIHKTIPPGWCNDWIYLLDICIEKEYILIVQDINYKNGSLIVKIEGLIDNYFHVSLFFIPVRPGLFEIIK